MFDFIEGLQFLCCKWVITFGIQPAPNTFFI